MSLTAPERETVITFSDADDTATIHTHERKIITKLKNNPAARQVEDLTHDGTAGAVFEIPAELITFRKGRRSSPRCRPRGPPRTCAEGCGLASPDSRFSSDEEGRRS